MFRLWKYWYSPLYWKDSFFDLEFLNIIFTLNKQVISLLGIVFFNFLSLASFYSFSNIWTMSSSSRSSLYRGKNSPDFRFPGFILILPDFAASGKIAITASSSSKHLRISRTCTNLCARLWTSCVKWTICWVWQIWMLL